MDVVAYVLVVCFLEWHEDHDTAMSAVRNLNGQEVGGRPLRIDLADSDPFLEGKTTIRGELVDAHETRAQWREREQRESGRVGGKGEKHGFMANLPKGVPVPPGQTAMDAISQVLASQSPAQTTEILAQMKAFVITHPDQARALLVAHPQLGYALFQALLLSGIVDPSVLSRMLSATTRSGAPTATAPPPPPSAPAHPPPVTHSQSHLPPPGYPAPNYNAPPPSMMGHHPQGASPMYPPPGAAHHMPPAGPPGYYGRPPMPPPPVMPQPPQQVIQPTPVQAPPQAPAAAPAAAIDPAQRDMIMQVLSLSNDTINQLPPAQRDQIHQLRKQFGLAP